MARGVKPRETMPRSLVCCGGSMLSMTNRCSSICSRVAPSACRMIAVFSHVEYVSLSREISTTSACLVTTQYPSSSKPPRARPLRVPPDRRGAPQLGELILGHPVRVQVRVGEIETWR